MQTNEENPYEQGGQRTMIAHSDPHGGWIVWNWNTASWDHLDERPCAIAKGPEEAKGN